MQPEAVVVMKVGFHAGEEWSSIIKRKNREIADTGRALWGYGGSACHPTRQVQPFAREYGSALPVAMVPTRSRGVPTSLIAEEMSADDIHWQPIPEGIRTGSKWALVLSELHAVDDELDLGGYVVAVGPSAGKKASDYLRGQSDKACLRRADGDGHDVRGVVIRAQLREPWAVFLRGSRTGSMAV